VVMVTRVCLVWLMLASVASAGTSFIELVPETPGPYAPGASVDVDVVFHNMEGEVITPRLLTLDFSATDPMLALPDTFHFQLVPPLIGDLAYTRFEDMPKVDIVLSLNCEFPGMCLWIPDGDSFLMGTLSVGVPNDPGTYLLDSANRDNPNTYRGARVDYGYREPTILHYLNGNLTGGQLAMTVVPEPVAAMLLALGALALAARRQPLRRIRT